MDIKQVQELVKIINKTNISEISIEEEGLKITIKQKDDAIQAVYSTPAPQQQYYTPPPAIAAPPPAQAKPAPTSAKPAETAKTENYVTIKSPMIGTFYRSSAPDKPVFVNVGDEVDNGKVVCIIEAMKLFN